MKIAILGFAGQGRSSFEYWNRDGNVITICDQNPDTETPEGVGARLGPAYLKGLDEFDLLVRTPILHPKDIVAANPEAPKILTKVTTNTNEFFKACPSRNTIGVTGTKGKGTTSTLITKMLEAAGFKVHLGGNIGTPPLELLKNGIQPEDWVVLELANFQLIDLRHSPHIGVCLMVEPEHMDWHSNIGEYLMAKQQMFRWQSPSDISIYYAANEHSKHVASVGKNHIPYMSSPGAQVVDGKITIDDQVICAVTDLKLLGKHNWQNVCAAVTAVWQVTHDADAMRKVLTTFSGLEHRLELVAEINGVKYYDDSFGTTPETSIVAIEAFNQPKVLILGGSDKGASFDNLANAVIKNNVRQVILIGNTSNPEFKAIAPEIETSLRSKGYANIISLVRPGGYSMADVIKTATEASKPGDIILLSTASASFDMFKNYKDRGEQFKKAVLSPSSAGQ